MIAIIRSGIYGVYFYVVTLIVAVLSLPVLLACILLGRAVPMLVPKIWAYFIIYGAKYIAGIKFVIEGTENIPKSGAVIACKHQSAWETIVFHLVVKNPSYIYRDEINKIPLFGSYISRLNQIAVKRGGKTAAIESIQKGAKEAMAQGHVPVIFPEGTRVPVEVGIKGYKSGIYHMAQHVGALVVPAALNSGYFWPRNKFWGKKPGTITLRFLPAIKLGKDKNAFMKKLEDTIESEQKKLVALAK